MIEKARDEYCCRHGLELIAWRGTRVLAAMSGFSAFFVLLCSANTWIYGVTPQTSVTSIFYNDIPRTEQSMQSSTVAPIKVQARTGPMIDEQRRQLALESFKKYPDAFSEASKGEILAQRIVPGMTPYQAQLAGGRFAFKVKADPRWPEGTSPLLIIETQSVDPDDSEISLTFKNATQYGSDDPIAFRVDFVRGRVSGVVALK